MQDERKVISKERTAVTGDGSVVTEKAQATKISTDPKVTTANLVWYIFGFITIVLAIRFIMKLAGANSANDFVGLVYSISGVLSAPFDTIFGVKTATAGTVNSVFEPSILVATAVYGLIAWGITKLLTLNEPRQNI